MGDKRSYSMFDRTVEAEILVTFKQYLDVSMKNPDQD